MCSLALDPSNPESVSQCLVCPNELYHLRSELASNVVEAYTIVRHFADSNNWQDYMQKPLFTSIQIFDSQKKLWGRVRELTESTEKYPPTDGLSAALCSSHLIVVSPEVYKQVRPEYARINKAWVRLLAHEMFHQLHICIVGTEGKMGPRWFYEGFAMYAVGQHFGPKILSVKDAIKAIHVESRGSYAKYVAAFEYFLDRIDLNLLLQKASEQDFEPWLVSMANSVKKNHQT